MNKNELRKKLIKQRAKITKDEREVQSSEIIEILLASEIYQNSTIIFTFYGMSEEIDTEILIRQAFADGKKVALPLALDKGLMEAYQVTDVADLQQDKFGIMSPNPAIAEKTDPEAIDLAIVPLLGYNLHGYRIGYGAGYYDRYLPRLSTKCTTMGIAFTGQEVETLPVDVNDYPLDMILTPDGFVDVMTRVETHCHSSEFSPDCTRNFANLIGEAEKKHFKIITLTDHYDKDIIEGRAQPGQTKVGSLPQKDEWIFSLNEYIDFFLAERQKLKERESQTELLIGIELGYQDYLADDYKEIIPRYPFDLIIGSIHTMFFDDFAVDGKKLYGLGKQKAYAEYLEALIEMVKSGLDFDVLGHFDYVTRYSDYEDPQMYYKDHQVLFDNLFKAIIERNISLEVNTRTRYRQIVSGETDPGLTDINIFRRYYDLGGRLVTFATDAHSKGELHCLVSETVQKFKQMGFKQGTYYVQRQPVFYEL